MFLAPVNGLLQNKLDSVLTGLSLARSPGWSISRDLRRANARDDLFRSAENATHVHLLVSGWACRYQIQRNGIRQITAIILPGDFCDAQLAVVGRLDFGVTALTALEMVSVPLASLSDPVLSSSTCKALWRATAIDEATSRAWLINIARRPAEQRIANLFCELQARLVPIGLADTWGFRCPFTQAIIGDVLGLTPIHINRSLRALRERGLLTFRDGVVAIPALAALKRFGDFNSGYLGLRSTPSAH